jgi:hypothetical protein
MAIVYGTGCEMTVDDFPQETIGMIRARRWADWVPAVLTGAIIGAVGWRAGLVFAAVAVTIRLEVNRTLATIWPECYHAVRKAVEDDRGE